MIAHSNKTKVNDIKLIYDNGGGITLQIITPDNYRYQHLFLNANEHIINCINDALSGASDITHWDNNEADNWLCPTDDEVNYGGYTELEDITSIQDVIDIGMYSSWLTIQELSDIAQKIMRQNT